MKNKRAFTLIEIMVVMSILIGTAFLSAMIFRYNQPKIDLYAGARDLRRDLQIAREMSLTEQVEHGVRFQADLSQYELVKSVSGSIVIIETHPLPNGIIFESLPAFTNNTVFFNKEGASSQSGTVVLSNDDSNTKNITISPSGYVRIQ